MAHADANTLEKYGINPSAQRLAVAEYVLHTKDHPSADEVWGRVQERLPQVSRATVYNTLNLFVSKGMIRQFVLTAGRVVFDPKLEEHHHFIDENSGAIYDIPWNAIKVTDPSKLDGFDVQEYQVVMRGRKTRKKRRASG